LFLLLESFLPTHEDTTLANARLEISLYAEDVSMIARYTRPEMARIWSDENKYRCWLQVEVAASQALAADGTSRALGADSSVSTAAIAAAAIMAAIDFSIAVPCS